MYEQQLRPINAANATCSNHPGAYMHPRTRKLIGTFVLLAYLIVYALLAMAAAIVLQVNGVGRLGELAYYLVAGLLWVPPAGLIVQWMQYTPPEHI